MDARLAKPNIEVEVGKPNTNAQATIPKGISTHVSLSGSGNAQAEVKKISASAALNVTVSGGGDLPIYRGETEVTPTSVTQTLYTGGKTVIQNITINPIPSNYGLITWNGSYITVS